MGPPQRRPKGLARSVSGDQGEAHEDRVLEGRLVLRPSSSPSCSSDSRAWPGVIPSLERWAYDVGREDDLQAAQRARSPSSPSTSSRSPTSGAGRGRARCRRSSIDQLAAAKAKVIGNTMFFFEPQKDPGLVYVEKVLDIYSKAYPRQRSAPTVPGVAPIGGATPAAQESAAARPEVAEIGKILTEASGALEQRRAPGREREEGRQRAGADGVRPVELRAAAGHAPTRRCPSTSRPTSSAPRPTAAARSSTAGQRWFPSSRSGPRRPASGTSPAPSTRTAPCASSRW